MREKIKSTMLKKEISPSDLAKRTGIRYQTITNFLNLGYNIFYSNFEKIIFELDLELTEKKEN